MRAVIDTNILVSAVIRPQGIVGLVLAQLRERKYTMLISRAALDELVDVLHRPHLRAKYHLSDQTLHATLRLIVLRSEMVHPQTRIAICRDPDDDKFLELAVAGNADLIVSGDKDLLVLDPFQGIPIVTPRVFLEKLGRGRPKS